MLNKQSKKWSFKICLCLIYHQQMALMIRWYRQATSSCSVFPRERSRANQLKFLGLQLAAWTASIKTISTNTSLNPKIPYPTSIWSYRQLVCRLPRQMIRLQKEVLRECNLHLRFQCVSWSCGASYWPHNSYDHTRGCRRTCSLASPRICHHRCLPGRIPRWRPWVWTFFSKSEAARGLVRCYSSAP